MYKYVFPHVFLLSGAPTSLTSGATHSPCTTLPAGPSKVTPSSATSLDPSASRATTLLKRFAAFFFQKSPSVHLLTIWSTSAGGTSKPKCYRSACHTRHWSLYNGNVLQVSKIYLLNTSPLKWVKSKQIKGRWSKHKLLFTKVQLHTSKPHLWLLERRRWEVEAGLLQEAGDRGRVSWLLGPCRAWASVASKL